MSAVPDPLGHPPLERYLTLPGFTPTVLTMILGYRLRALREAAEISAKDASEVLDCSEAKISRLERGESPLREGDIEVMLRMYGAQHELETVCELARRSKEAGWWERYGSAIIPKWFDKFVGLQEGSKVIRTFEVQLVPGLLQTAEYAYAVAQGGFPATAEEIRAKVELRLRRQDLLERPDAPHLWAVLDWPVLQRPVGGREVMRGQIQHLITMSRRPNIKIQVLPPGCVAIGSPVTLLRFEEYGLPDVVYLEHPTGANYLDKPEETGRYRLMLDDLAVMALSPAQTRKELRRIARELE
ncbi:helix-turn-helix domain-containing protein [Streptomyces sp. NBC_00273]|uniref:helix-turn-helix domain-containing protein n=1 Tax=Streptomyces sp. NBC_00273 TaxID=2903644 RepID=UPI002E2A7777|nr:helix-turn-helix transcriptional regulator [Streptomyces sp. NBC_00273]